MNTLVILAISLAVLGTCSADDEMQKKKEKIVSFYKCLSCAGDEAIAAYEKCEQFKPEKSVTQLKECLKKVMPEEALKQPKRWNYFCENPVSVEKTFDCIATEDYFKSLTEEDISSLMKFRECAKGVKEQYCKT